MHLSLCCHSSGATYSKYSKFNSTVSCALTGDKSTFVTEDVYSKILLRRLSPKFTLQEITPRNSNSKSDKFNLSNVNLRVYVNIGAWLNIATLFLTIYLWKDRSAFNFMHLVKMFSEALKHVLVSLHNLFFGSVSLYLCLLDVYHVPIFIITVLINFLILYLQWYENFSIIDNDIGICRNVF